MHDAFLKTVFADRRMVEILIHGHAPEWAAKIDFSTLREESTGLVSKKTLQRRHPDMIWSADNRQWRESPVPAGIPANGRAAHGPPHDHLHRADA